MVQLTRIYTKGGDRGKTSLGNGARVFKNSLRINAIGEVDETNATLGLICTSLEQEDLQDPIRAIQNDLFDIGADLCMPKAPDEASFPHLQITEDHVHALEAWIDFYNRDLTPLNSFVLPGGSLLSAYFHLGRTICRRAERTCVALSQDEYVNPSVIHYLNRLSDLLFVLARWCNNQGKKDVLWIPGKTKKEKESSLKK